MDAKERCEVARTLLVMAGEIMEDTAPEMVQSHQNTEALRKRANTLLIAAHKLDLLANCVKAILT